MVFYTSLDKQARKIAQIRRNVFQHNGQPEQNNPQGNHQAIAASALKALKTVSAITISYIIVWIIPLFALWTRIDTRYWLQCMGTALMSCNTIWNPIILCIANKPFRIAFLQVILKIKAACCGGKD